MNGLIALLGSGEYLPVMDEVDRHLLASTHRNGSQARVLCLPTAAGQEGDFTVGRWSRMGEGHFRALGAQAEALRIIDRASADDPQFEPLLEAADLIYFSGGNPLYLYETMQGSRAWAAAQKAWSRGAVYAGCSAGAMILAREMPNFRTGGLTGSPGFGIVPAVYVMPHFDHIPGPWKVMVNLLRGRLKEGEIMLGLDEDTALVGRLGGEWRVLGKSRVHVITRKGSQTYTAGQSVPLAG